MDFCALPVMVQHHIMRSMDVKGFLKTAHTSRAMLEMARACRDKTWEQIGISDEREGGDLYSLTLDGLPFGPGNLPIHTIRLVAHNATVNGLSLWRPFPQSIDVRSRRLTLYHEFEALLPVLKRHKPAGKYVYAYMTVLLPPTTEFLAWINGNVEVLTATISAQQSKYVPLNLPRMYFYEKGSFDMAAERFTQTLVTEWLQGEREIEWVYSYYQPAWDARTHPPLDPAFYARFPKIAIPRSGAVEIWYRLRRPDGKVLILKCVTNYLPSVTFCIPHQAIEHDCDQMYKDFVFGRG